MVAGLAVGWHARLPAGRLARPGLATTYAVVVVLLGPGSMAMHATQSERGGRLDQLSMYLVACFALAYALMRATRRSTGSFLAVFAGLLVLCEAVEQWHTDLPVVDNTGNLVFGIILVGRDRHRGVAAPSRRPLPRRPLGARRRRRDRHRLRDLEPLEERHSLCHPHSLLQGHAAWHLLCAVSAWCLYRYWASGTSTEPRPAHMERLSVER